MRWESDGKLAPRVKCTPRAFEPLTTLSASNPKNRNRSHPHRSGITKESTGGFQAAAARYEERLTDALVRVNEAITHYFVETTDTNIGASKRSPDEVESVQEQPQLRFAAYVWKHVSHTP